MRPSPARRALACGLLFFLFAGIAEVTLLILKDIQLHGASLRTAATTAAVQLPAAGMAPPPPPLAPPAPPPALPRVALLFLTLGPMPHEQLWRRFLEAASAAADVAVGGSAAQQPAADRWRLLFSLYVHPPPNYTYPATSLFSGHELPKSRRVTAGWGQHSMVQAELALLAAALRDPLNQRFALLSESCVPLLPPAAIWSQLVGEQQSRINACQRSWDPEDANRRMDWRWQPGMAPAVPKAAWRKSSQWWGLTRRHAEVVVAARGGPVDAAFQRECWVDSGEQPKRWCVPDEHEIPTLLAVAGLEAEVACDGVLTHAYWGSQTFHPKTYKKGEATPATLNEMRANCSAGRLMQSSRQQLERLGALSRAGGWVAEAVEAAAAAPPLLPPSCPLFARKIAAEAAEEWFQLLSPLLAQWQ